MQPDYYVSEVSTKEDLAQAISLWQRNFSMAVDTGMERFHWFYETNPYRKGRLWLLKLKDGEKAVGVGGVGYRRFSVSGRSLIGVVGVDFAVDKEHRALGPALKLQRAIMESTEMETDFRYSFPTKQAQVVLKYFGYHKIGDLTRLVKILRSSEYLQRVVRPAFLAKVISIPVDFFLRLRSIMNRTAPGYEFYSGNVEDSHSLFGDLWERFARGNLLLGERTSNFLDWRYSKCPTTDYRIFALKAHNEDLKGFIVYYLQGQRFYVDDLICPESELLNTLIAGFERQCFQTPANSISISLLGAKNIAEHLISMGYRVREPEQSLWVYAKDKDLLAKFKDIDNSYWLLGDFH